MIDCTNNFFHLHNEKISYLFYVMPNHQLGHLYYGKNLGQLSQDELEYLADHSNRGAEITEYDPKMKDFSLGDRMQEYPVFGTSDFREGALDIKLGQEQVYPDFKYDHYEINRGKKRNESYPASYGDDAENLIIYLKDEDHGLDIKLTYSIFSDVAAVVRKAEIHNYSDQQYFIENMQSGVLDLPESNYDFLQLSGAWIKERHIRRRPLEQGITKVESLRGATSHQANPFVALVDKNVSNNHGEIFASNLIYSGNFVSQVQVDEWHTSRLMTGVNPQYFTWQLDSGENFAVPEAVLFYTTNGYNGLMQETHTFAKKHVIAQKWLHEKRPIVINNWEATYFDFDEEKLMHLARKAKEVGIECFVLDDGWFGKRDNDHSSLGNWTINRKKFPLGLEHFSKQIHELGMQFGLWFEPEMVSADAPIYQEHPEWVVRHPYQRASIGRNQYVLDFANPEVVDNIFNQMKTVNVPVYSFEAEESKSSELAKGTELQVNGAIYLWNDKVQRADLYYHLTNRKHVDAGDVFVKASDVDYKSGKKLTPINTAEEAENNYKIAVSELDEITLKDLINKENTVKASTKYKKASSDKKYNYEQAVSEAKTATMAKDIMSAAQAKYLIWSLKTYESELDG